MGRTRGTEGSVDVDVDVVVVDGTEESVVRGRTGMREEEVCEFNRFGFSVFSVNEIP